jgi:mannosyltransferase OCH1-like enzyme
MNNQQKRQFYIKLLRLQLLNRKKQMNQQKIGIRRSIMRSNIIPNMRHNIKSTTMNQPMVNAVKTALSVSYPTKTHYNNVIPLNIFQTWHSKQLPPMMFKNSEFIKQNNPAFNYMLFDDKDCREFIKTNFNSEVLNAFDTLIPGAYKADLWRYCVLYIRGGIYIDIKYAPINGFKFISLTEKEHWVLDIDNNGVYNALIVAKPGNAILLQAINSIVDNVKNRYYGGSCLDPTGPLLLAKLFSSEQKHAFDMKHTFYVSMKYRFILFNNYFVFKSYNEYLNEHAKNQKVPHYSVLWNQRGIYK